MNPPNVTDLYSPSTASSKPADLKDEADWLADPELAKRGVTFGFRHWDIVCLALLLIAVAFFFTYQGVVTRTQNREFALRAAYEYYSQDCHEKCLYLENYEPMNFTFHNFNEMTRQDGQYKLEGTPTSVRAWLFYVIGPCEHNLVVGFNQGALGCPASYDNKTGEDNATWSITYVRDWHGLG